MTPRSSAGATGTPLETLRECQPLAVASELPVGLVPARGVGPASQRARVQTRPTRGPNAREPGLWGRQGPRPRETSAARQGHLLPTEARRPAAPPGRSPPPHTQGSVPRASPAAHKPRARAARGSDTGSRGGMGALEASGCRGKRGRGRRPERRRGPTSLRRLTRLRGGRCSGLGPEGQPQPAPRPGPRHRRRSRRGSARQAHSPPPWTGRSAAGCHRSPLPAPRRLWMLFKATLAPPPLPASCAPATAAVEPGCCWCARRAGPALPRPRPIRRPRPPQATPHRAPGCPLVWARVAGGWLAG